MSFQIYYGMNRSMPIPQDYCQGFNPNNEMLPTIWQRPKLIEFYNSTNIVLDRFTARNSPLWFIHVFLSKNIAMTNLTILAPREVGNTDGLDPDSSQNILMDTCYIDVGDDGVSIKVRIFGNRESRNCKWHVSHVVLFCKIIVPRRVQTIRA